MLKYELLDHAATVEKKTKALINACKHGDFEEAKVLLEQGANPHTIVKSTFSNKSKTLFEFVVHDCNINTTELMTLLIPYKVNSKFDLNFKFYQFCKDHDENNAKALLDLKSSSDIIIDINAVQSFLLTTSYSPLKAACQKKMALIQYKKH